MPLEGWIGLGDDAVVDALVAGAARRLMRKECGSTHASPNLTGTVGEPGERQ